jgi:hypothetical protein
MRVREVPPISAMTLRFFGALCADIFGGTFAR